MKSYREIAAVAGISRSGAHQRVVAWKTRGMAEEEARRLAETSPPPDLRQPRADVPRRAGRQPTASITLTYIAAQTGLSQGTVWERVQRLKGDGLTEQQARERVVDEGRLTKRRPISRGATT